MSRIEQQPTNFDQMLSDGSNRERRPKHRAIKALIGGIAVGALVGAGVGGYRSFHDSWESSRSRLQEEIATSVKHGEITNMYLDSKLCIAGYDADIETTAMIDIKSNPLGSSKLGDLTKSEYGTAYHDTLETMICAAHEQTERNVRAKAPLMAERDHNDPKEMAVPTVVTLTLKDTAFEGVTYPVNLINGNRFTDNSNAMATAKKAIQGFGSVINHTVSGVPNYEPTGSDKATNFVQSLAVATAVDYTTKSCSETALKSGLYDAMVDELKKEEADTYNEGHNRKITADDVTITVVDKDGKPTEKLQISSQYDFKAEREAAVDKLKDESSRNLTVSLNLASADKAPVCKALPSDKVERRDPTVSSASGDKK